MTFEGLSFARAAGEHGVTPPTVLEVEVEHALEQLGPAQLGTHLSRA
jgi:hypothetical protein